ncbi:MAG TPA: hypothetical protein VK861_10950, partial [Bacteroidales bacterium]|nr:hypothetical protein [Bacteroidales bacterium]
MKRINASMVIIFILVLILGAMLIYSRTFEELLKTVFQSKFPEGSRTPLFVLFIEHMEMVVISSAMAIIVGTTLGIFLTTSYGA